MKLIQHWCGVINVLLEVEKDLANSTSALFSQDGIVSSTCLVYIQLSPSLNFCSTSISHTQFQAHLYHVYIPDETIPYRYE